MSDKKFEGIDWNRNGKRDMGDRYIEMKIVEKIHEEEEKMRNDPEFNNVSAPGCSVEGCLPMVVLAFILLMIIFFS